MNQQYILYDHPKAITSKALVKHLEQKNVALGKSRRLLKQVKAVDPVSGKKYTALALKNEEDGLELFSPNVSGYTGERAISFIRGRPLRIKLVHIFPDIWNAFASPVMLGDGSFIGDAVILNAANINSVLPYIRGYGYQVLCTWLENTEKGGRQMEKMQHVAGLEPDLLFLPMNVFYSPFRTVHDWNACKGQLNFNS